MATKEKAAKTDNGNTVNRIAAFDTPEIMKPKIVTFLLTGTSSLIQNNPANFIGQNESGGLVAGKKVYKAEDEAALRVYKDKAGNFCHPSEAITRSMVKGVGGKKFGKMFATAVLKSTVFLVEKLSVIEDEEGNPVTSYEIDSRPVVVGNARVMRHRPEFPVGWTMRVSLEVDTAIITPEAVLSAMNLAGRIVGIGEMRPALGGGYGRFTANIV